MNNRQSGSKDLYGILQIGKQATDEEIKKAYKKQALLWHPVKKSRAIVHGMKLLTIG